MTTSSKRRTGSAAIGWRVVASGGLAWVLGGPAAFAQGAYPAWGAYGGGLHLNVGQFSPLQLDQTGNLLVDIAAGAAASPSSINQGQAGTAAWLVADSNSAAFQGVVAMTPGAAATTATFRGIGFVITTAGNVTFTFVDGSSLLMAVQLAGGGFQSLPFAVTRVTYPSSGAAAGSFWGLK